MPAAPAPALAPSSGAPVAALGPAAWVRLWLSRDRVGCRVRLEPSRRDRPFRPHFPPQAQKPAVPRGRQGPHFRQRKLSSPGRLFCETARLRSGLIHLERLGGKGTMLWTRAGASRSVSRQAPKPSPDCRPRVPMLSAGSGMTGAAPRRRPASRRGRAPQGVAHRRPAPEAPCHVPHPTCASCGD